MVPKFHALSHLPLITATCDKSPHPTEMQICLQASAAFHFCFSGLAFSLWILAGAKHRSISLTLPSGRAAEAACRLSPGCGVLLSKQINRRFKKKKKSIRNGSRF